MLVTPVQYESAFDGLNEVRPLELADEVKVALDIPVLNANPVSSSRPAIGKLLRCNQRGGILQTPSNKYTYTGYLEYAYIAGVILHRFTFSEVTPFVICEDIYFSEPFGIRWTDSTGAIVLDSWPNGIKRILPFYGKHLWISKVGPNYVELTMRVHYFTK